MKKQDEKAPALKMAEFRRLLDIHSADLSCWPVDKVKPALALTESSPAAKAEFDRALALDAQLRGYAPAAAPMKGLEEKIMQAAAMTPQHGPRAASRQRRSRKTKSFWKPSWLFAPSGGLIAVALAGFIIGNAPEVKRDYLMDPVFYSQDQVIAGDNIDSYTGSLF